MGHLLRRAGFGASRAEIEAKAAQGYDAVVEELLNPNAQPPIDEDIMVRYHPAYNQSAAIETNVQQWLYRMINTPRQLQEKMTLFWHMIFCAGHSKIDSGAGNGPDDRHVPGARHGQLPEPAHAALHLRWDDVLSG